MDHPWRHHPPPPPPPPPIPGNNNINNICPICSIPHFPFCPPPPLPPFFQNPRFNHPPPPFHHPPPFDPHLPPPNNFPNQSDHRRPIWHGSSNPTFNMGPYNVNNNHHNNNIHPVGYDYNYDYDNGGVKRMKVESFENVRAHSGEIGIGGFPSDSERILKLIHDHGNAAAADAARRGSGPVSLGSEANGDVGLKRRREMMEIGYYDQRFELGQHGSQATGDLMQSSHHNLLLSRRNGEADNHGYGSQQPYNWSEAKGYYGYGSQPPLPASPPPPPPPPMDIPRNHFFKPLDSQPPPPPPPKKASLFPVAGSSSVDSSLGAVVLEKQSSAPVYYANNVSRHASSVSSAEDFHIRQSSTEQHARDIQPFPLRHLSLEKQNIVDGSHIFKQPHRATRPDHFVIILRGLPGSGKSYLAKMLRDIEVENGGEAPRIHSMDEYFMIEVEKEEDSELSKSSGSFRGKRQVMKTVMEYCYEPELEEAYRASMLKAFKKTLDEGVYSFIIVDDRNLRVADFAQFWATAKRSGYEVYLVEASYKDPAGCAARNVHNFTLPDIQKMAGQWEEAPSLYLKMDIKSLLHGDGFDESDIQEVDMDMEDDDAIDASQEPDIKRPHDETKDQVDDFRPHDDLKDATVTNHKAEEVKDLSRSKWSNDFDADEEGDGMNKNSVGALSGLAQAYSSKEAKSVCWGDQGGNVGFSISATRKTNTRSLVIGPGPGYNLKSNPLSEQDYLNPVHNAVASKTQNVFQERIRAEHESFKAVFDKRRHRIGGFNMDEE